VSRRTAAVSLLLLLAINLFNYVDRQALSAAEPNIRQDILHEPASAGSLPSTAPSAAGHAKTRTGTIAAAFVLSYTFLSPLFGWLADRASRWLIFGTSVILWSLASGGSGLAATFAVMLATRVFVGIGEAGYGPAAPTMIADLYPIQKRGSAMAWFYMAIPVGSALGYVLVGLMTRLTHHWRTAFYAMVPPGVLLGVCCFFMKDPPRGYIDRNANGNGGAPLAALRDYLAVFKVPSYLLDTAGMVAMTFAIGGISFFLPGYLQDRRAAADPEAGKMFLGVVLLVAGITATLSGGFIGDWLQRRWGGAYFAVSAVGIFLSVAFIVLMLRSPFPVAWVWLFLGAFFLFFNTGPSNTILANVIRPSMRATAFALNILVIHVLGDVLSPPLMGTLVDRYHSWVPAFDLVCVTMSVGGLLWLWGALYLKRDTARASMHPAAKAEGA
jgi:MFS family permease